MFNIELQDLVFLKGMAPNSMLTVRVYAIISKPDLNKGKMNTVEYKGTLLSSSSSLPKSKKNTIVEFHQDSVIDVLKRSYSHAV